MDRLLGILSDVYYWELVILILAIWYVLSIAISRVMFNAGDDPLRAARRGPWWALLIVLVVEPVVTWLIWKDATQTVMLTAAAVTIPVGSLSFLLRFEPVIKD